MNLKAYSPSNDDFVKDAFTDKRTRASSKADEPVSKKSKKPAVSSKPSKTAASSKPSKPSGSSKPSKPSGSSNPEDPKPVLSKDLKPGLNLRQNLQAGEDKFQMVKIKNFPVVKERSNENYIEWRAQFGSTKKNPRLYVNKDLLPLIRKQIERNDCGKLFMMNMICLFSTILFHVVSMGTLNIAVMSSLVDLTKVRQMNWCKYVVDCMKHEKSEWKAGKPFFGPILLLEFISYNNLKIADDVIPNTGTEDDIQRTESDPMADPMTGTDQTSKNRNDEPSSSSIKLTQQQLSAMIFEFQGEYSQFKSAEEFSNSLKNLLCLFQEMKINIDDMLRAGLEKHPRNESLLEVQEWMNKLVNRTTSESSQKEDESSQMLMITMGDDTDGSKAKEASTEIDEPQPDNPTEPTFTQLCLDPAFMEAFEKIDRRRQSAEMETKSVNSKANMTKFVEEMTNLLFISVYQSIKDIDLMIFPMMLVDEHYYLVCFNLREPQIHIIDNMNVKGSIKDRYGKKFAHVRYLFIKYLKDNGYPHYQELDEYKVANLKMSWQTSNNYIDCGIFAMRHMETRKRTKETNRRLEKEVHDKDSVVRI
ncbi:ulp1 protease family, C-terminal catalytic domain-containing protein [Artemisia annua]|uniref:Ulp1 protease family, C-terminal catalytic domain-containing protein n=1 Tax=Artemisia annua TaxID=35608 RepID=A0A2U1MPR7_ARTAN|nr:ulp1 protease family, C-terminal catalytic domain-containing protein [Artemisia annua]